MKRVLEPELMTNIQQVEAYSNADFSASDKAFVNYVVQKINKKNLKVLDLGCGSADVDIEFAKKMPTSKILAIDGSKQMVDLAIEKIKNYNLEKQIILKKQFLNNMQFNEPSFDIIMSKDLLHHLHQPDIFWSKIEKISNTDTSIFVMDLIRPESITEAKQIVKSIAFGQPEILQQDFYNSLLASFTIDEIKQQIEQYPLEYKIEQITERHFVVKCHKNNSK